MSKFHRQVAHFCNIVNLDEVESSVSFGGICHALHCLLYFFSVDGQRLHNSQQAAMNGREILDQLLEAKMTDCIIKAPDTKELDIW